MSETAAECHDLLARLGRTARPAGSVAESEARALCAEWLENAGFAVEQRSFGYSAFPGLCGTPIAGLVLLLAAIVAGLGIALGGTSVDGSVVAGVTLVITASVGGWWLVRFGTMQLPFARREGVNLEAHRGVPVVWLVAHIDSKSQPVSLLTRAVASIAVATSWICLILLWAASRIIHVPDATLLAVASCGGAASVPLLVAWIGARGSGALDNATGVATVLLAARVIDPRLPVGVVITSAEELGLAGARAWVRSKPASVVINCDGVDDAGPLTITASGSGSHLLRSLRSAGALPFDARFRRAMPGVMLDATAFADADWAACTVSKGTRYSLARVHTSRDTMDYMSGTGVDSAAGAIVSARAGSNGGL